MKIGLDIGFGHTKVVYDGGELKFPTWLAYHTPSSIDSVEVIEWDGKKYVVGEDVRYEPQRIELPDFGEIIKYFPVFLKFVEKKLKQKIKVIITGVPPKYKELVGKVKEKCESMDVSAEVVPQGVGIYLDTKEKIDKTSEREAFILDIGFNTVDYLIVKNDRKIKGDTIEKFGVMKAVELFKSYIPKEHSYLRNFSTSKLMSVFEKGYAVVEGEKLDLSSYQKKAKSAYREMLVNRLKQSVGDFIYETELVIIAGGGAFLFKNESETFGKNVYIPPKPEFSNARGYLKAGRKQ